MVFLVERILVREQLSAEIVSGASEALKERLGRVGRQLEWVFEGLSSELESDGLSALVGVLTDGLEDRHELDLGLRSGGKRINFSHEVPLG